MDMKDKRQIKLNLKKLQTLVETISKMVDEDRYCPDIMQQVLAGVGLLRSVHRQLLRTHLESCFVKAAESGDKKKQKEMIEEIIKVTNLYNK